MHFQRLTIVWGRPMWRHSTVKSTSLHGFSLHRFSFQFVLDIIQRVEVNLSHFLSCYKDTGSKVKSFKHFIQILWCDHHNLFMKIDPASWQLTLWGNVISHIQHYTGCPKKNYTLSNQAFVWKLHDHYYVNSRLL